jgi:hypothetical protein
MNSLGSLIGSLILLEIIHKGRKTDSDLVWS